MIPEYVYKDVQPVTGLSMSCWCTKFLIVHTQETEREREI